MALHRDSSDDFVTQPIGQPVDQLIDGDALSDDFVSPPSSRHAASEGTRHSLRSLRSTFRKGGVWWKVLVVFVVIWALGRFGGDPAPAAPPPVPAATTPACPTPSAVAHSH